MLADEDAADSYHGRPEEHPSAVSLEPFRHHGATIGKTSDASVVAHSELHGLVLLVAGLGHLCADLQDSVHLGVFGLRLDVRQVCLPECVQLGPDAFAYPVLELCGAIRVGESGDALRLSIDLDILLFLFGTSLLFHVQF